MIDIIRINSKYKKALSRLSDKDKSYILDGIFAFANGESFEIKDSGAGDLLELINGENELMCIKAIGKAKYTELKAKQPMVRPMVEPMVEPMVATKVKESKVKEDKIKESKIKEQLSKDNEQSSNLVSYEENGIKKFGNKEINDMQDFIKNKITELGFIYNPGKYEKSRIKNILTAKRINDLAKNNNMTIYDFVGNILLLTEKLDFWSGKINNAEKFYKNYVNILNDGIKIKQKLKEQKKDMIDLSQIEGGDLFFN